MAEGEQRDIETCEDVQRVVQTNPQNPAVRRYTIKRAIELGCLDSIPEQWELEIEND